MTRKLATIADVAKRAGVSMKTASRVFNNAPNVRAEKRDAVLKAAKLLAYRPNISARQLAGNRSYIITHLYDNPNADYVANIYNGMRRACDPAGFYAVAQYVAPEEGNYLSAVRAYLDRHYIDAIVLSPPLSDDLKLLDELSQRGVLTGLVSPTNDVSQFISVGIDDVNAAYQMTCRLCELGHKKIAFVSGPDNHASSDARRTGFKRALEQYNLERHNNLFQGDFSLRSGMRAYEQITQQSTDYTAIFAANDEMAIGLIMAALRDGKKIPQNLSVAGFDNTEFASMMWPSLSTVSQPIALMAEETAKRLIDMSTQSPSDTPPSSYIKKAFEVNIINRESTAPLSGSSKDT